MTATTTTAAATTTSTTRTPGLWKTGALAGLAAAAATTAFAAAAMGAGVPLTVEGEQIPLAGYAQLTIMCTAIGVLLAKALGRWASRPRRSFVVATGALTALSLVPDVVIAASAASKLVLIATHLVAAAIVIPAVARRLPRH